MTHEFANTVTDAQRQLYKDMRRDEWAEPGPDIVAPEIKRSRVLMRTVVGALFIIGAIAIARGVLGAEQPGRFEIVAYPAGKDLREDRPNLIVIAGPYSGREECRIAIASVKLANGKRLRCDRIEDRRVK